MNEFKEWQLQFQQIYDGAYGYYDRCGEFMNLLRANFGFMPLSVTPNTCDMDAPDEALRIYCNAEVLTITSSDPDKAKSFSTVIDFASKAATEMFGPFRVHQNRMTISSIQKTRTQEESFEMSLSHIPAAATDLAHALQMVPIHQNLSFTFANASRVFTFTVQPVVTNISAGQRQLAQFGAAQAVIQHLAKRENLAQKIPPPSYGLAFDTTLIENEPPVELIADVMLNFLRDERLKILVSLKERKAENPR
jgi:hypothetical protein